MWFIILHCITGQNFKRIWLHLVGYGQKNTQKQPKIWNLKDIWKLGNYISDIKWNLHIWYKLRYVLTPTPLVYQKMRLSIRGKGGRGEGIPKLLVKVSLKFERSFGYLLPINPEKMWRKWYGNLLIITSPSTSSYYFSPSFFGHWHITLQSHFCRLKNLVRLISLNSTFCNIEIKKNF